MLKRGIWTPSPENNNDETNLLRWVAIAALMAGGTFTVAANPPAAPPVSYGVEEDVFTPCGRRTAWWPRWTRWQRRWASIFLSRAVTRWMRRSRWDALAVTHPQAGNTGGGGFMMLRTKDGKTTAIDFREMAPNQASRDMFLDDQGNPDSKNP